MTHQNALQTFGLPASRADRKQIRHLLVQEIDLARHSQDGEEMLRVLCMQLFSIGVAEDALLVWDAKCANLDAGIGLDIQFLCGAGLQATKDFLAESSDSIAAQALNYLTDCERSGDFADFSPAVWIAKYRRYYGLNYSMTPIFLMVGAPAVGKSTTGRVLAAKFPKSIHIKVDDVRDMVVSGLVYPGHWTPALIEQLSVARESATAMARIYHNAGFAVIIDDFYDPQSNLTEYQALQNEFLVHKILLYPNEGAALERNLKRSGPGEVSEYIANGVRAVYDYLRTAITELKNQGWIVLDTTIQDPEATATQIIERIS